MSLIGTDVPACSVRLFGEGTPEAPIEALTFLGNNFSGPPNDPTPPRRWHYAPESGAQPMFLLDPETMTPAPVPPSPPPGLHTLVSTYALVAVEQLGDDASPLPRPAPKAPTTPATLPFLKAVVSSTQWVGPVWMDVGRSIVVPSPHACVDIVAPEGWLVDPRESAVITPRVGGNGFAYTVWVYVKICRAFCCPTGLPICTETIANLQLDGVRVLTIPRGARRLWLSSLGTGGLVTWLAGPVNTPLLVMGTAAPATAASATEIEPVPGATHVALSNQLQAPGTNVTLAWEVQP